jgi:hypothetical protein
MLASATNTMGSPMLLKQSCGELIEFAQMRFSSVLHLAHAQMPK